jgi:type IV secretory pathway VirB3-like protein
MLFGVTQTFFVLSALPAFAAFILWMKPLWAFGLYGILYFFGLWGCWYDPFIFNIALGQCERVCPNRRYWGCNSYDPS